MVDEEKFVEEYGTAAYAGNASVLVGAGLSRAAGLPDWNELMRPLRRRAGIPSHERDLPLVAESSRMPFLAADRSSRRPSQLSSRPYRQQQHPALNCWSGFQSRHFGQLTTTYAAGTSYP